MILNSKSSKFNFSFYYKNGDRYIGEQIAIDLYEPFESELFLSCINYDSNIIDVGANIGYYSLLASTKINNGKIYAFEPNSLNFILLTMNILKNRYYNIYPSKKAISNEPGRTNLYLSEENMGDHQLFHSDGREYEVTDVDSIDNLFNNDHNINLIKIDTQGLDYNVLLGANKLIEHSKKLTVFTEFWMLGNNKAGIDSNVYYDFLKSSFDSVEYIDEQTSSTYSVDFDFIKTQCDKYNGINHVNLYCRK